MPLQFKNSERQVFLGCFGGINYCLYLYSGKSNIVKRGHYLCHIIFKVFTMSNGGHYDFRVIMHLKIPQWIESVALNFDCN